ncbi:MAG: hypothetical protein LBK71_12540 [Verrucomicrobiales bacterium]|jgi:hypothetical protein|nr:hypothetical protein [Verrucomicrobiales bacterium]
MKMNAEMIEKTKKQLNEALDGVDAYLNDWPQKPKYFTTINELRLFAVKIREMLESIDKGQAVPIFGIWRILETWPYKNSLRQKLVEAEFAYEKITKGP